MVDPLCPPHHLHPSLHSLGSSPMGRCHCMPWSCHLRKRQRRRRCWSKRRLPGMLRGKGRHRLQRWWTCRIPWTLSCYCRSTCMHRLQEGCSGRPRLRVSCGCKSRVRSRSRSRLQESCIHRPLLRRRCQSRRKRRHRLHRSDSHRRQLMQCCVWTGRGRTMQRPRRCPCLVRTP